MTEKKCACGHDHKHDHDHAHHHEHTHDGHCGCGHEHHHHHDEGCSCGCGGHHAPRTCHTDIPLNDYHREVLHALEHNRYLPVARFIVQSSTEDFSSVAMAPVFLLSPTDSMELARRNGQVLTELEEMGEITLDYDIPLSGYAYEEYKNSDLYAYFCKTVEEARGRAGFLGDTPVLELGSIARAEE